MPKDKIREETDKNPNTTYEDTKAHETTGFRQDDSIEVIKKQDTYPE